MIDRLKPPIADNKLPFTVPAVQSIKLANGIDISFVKKESLPIVFLEIIIFSGARTDPSEKRGLSYLTSLLIDEGAAEYNALELSDEFEKLGSMFSVSSDHDKTIFSILTLTEHFTRTLELLSKIIFQPRFDEDDFFREKKKVMDHILQLKEEPSFIASSAFERQIFKGTHYDSPEIGFVETVNQITNFDIKEYYSANLLKSEAKVIVVGSLTENEVADLLNKYLCDWKLSGSRQTKIVRPIITGTSFYFVDKKDSAQSEIRIGHIAKERNSEDYLATKIMNTILGGQFSSRINLNLRERKGFTYGANSSYLYYKDSAWFEVSTAVNTENTGEAIKEILNELDGIQTDIHDVEIDFAKSYLIKQFPSRFETFPQAAQNLETLIVHSLPENDLRDYALNVENVSKDQIRKAAEENIHRDQFTILVVGDKEKIFEQLKNLSGNAPIQLDVNGNLLS
jgi:zinc protease